MDSSAPIPESTPDSRSRWLVPTVVLVLTAAVFLPALNFGFVCDDSQQIVLNQARFTWSAIPHYFTTDVWSYIFLFKTNYYRPVFMLWLMLNYQLFGLNTVLWHTGALAGHLGATFLLYLVALRVTGRRSVAGAAALLFGVHPVHVEAVAWISGATETLFANLALGTILCHLRWRDPLEQRRIPWRAAEIGLFTLAMFAKETAIVFPILMYAWELLLPVTAFATLRKKAASALLAILPYTYVIFIYFIARFHALRSFAPLTRNWSFSMLVGTWPFALSFYLRQLLVPIQYSLFYPIAPVKHFSVTGVAIPLAVVVAAGALLVWIAWRSRIQAVCVLLLVLPILPPLNLRAFPFDDFLHDRYTYLPSAGLCILIALGIHKLIPSARLQTGVVLAIAALLAFVTIRTSQPWNDNLALYTHAAEVAPDSDIASEYLSQELVDEGRWAEALPLLNQALVRDPNSYEMYLRIGKCYLGLGDVDEAVMYFQDAATTFPLLPSAYLDLAVIELTRNQLTQAEDHMRLALRLRPAYSPLFDSFHLRLATILEREEKWADAMAEFSAELRENPDSEEAATGLDRAQKHLAAQAH